MKINFQFIPISLLLMFLFGCFGKKEKKLTLESWLETQSPGKYILVDKILNLDPKNLYYKKSSAIIGLKNNPDVQIKVEYSKNEPDLGLVITDIGNEFLVAENDMKVAKEIASALHQQGVEKISVGVITPAIYFLPFGEPAPDLRKKYLDNILAVLEKRNDQDRKSIWIEFMEDSVHGKEFKDIIPNGYWYRGDSYHDRNKIMSLDFEHTTDLDPQELNAGWKFNTASDRSLILMKDAYQQALKWSGQNLKQPIYLEGEQGVRFGLNDTNPMAVEYSFPYFHEKVNADDPDFETKINGFVSGIYLVDEKQFTNIKTEKEL